MATYTKTEMQHMYREAAYTQEANHSQLGQAEEYVLQVYNTAAP